MRVEYGIPRRENRADIRNGKDQRSIFLFSHPRTASNLLLRLFADHPRLAIIEYPWHDAFMNGPEKLMRRITAKGSEPQGHDPSRSHGPTYQASFDQLQREMSLAAKQVFITLLLENQTLILWASRANTFYQGSRLFLYGPKSSGGEYPSRRISSGRGQTSYHRSTS